MKWDYVEAEQLKLQISQVAMNTINEIVCEYGAEGAGDARIQMIEGVMLFSTALIDSIDGKGGDDNGAVG
jgi:hypothetical protein